jgi:hypothetical protein
MGLRDGRGALKVAQRSFGPSPGEPLAVQQARKLRRGQLNPDRFTRCAKRRGAVHRKKA